MDYYIFSYRLSRDGSEPQDKKPGNFIGRYYVKFRFAFEDEVYWNTITPLMQMKNGHPIMTLDVECCRMKGTLVVSTNTVELITKNHIYVFEKTNINPLDEVLMI